MTEYAKNNVEKIRQIKKRHQPKATKRFLERRRVDPTFKLLTLLRNRLNKALQSEFKNGQTIELLGCSVEFLKRYLEDRFLPGMTWDNHGKWHIDHIFPLSKANLADEKELKRVCHFSNLQPLWASDNIVKRNRI